MPALTPIRRKHRFSRFLLAATAASLFSGCTQPVRIKEPLAFLSPVRDPSFARSMGSLVGAPFVPGNHVTPLNNGREIFASMLHAIRSAKRSINFENYIFDRGTVPAEFSAALVERARAGVKVNLIFDAFGSRAAKVYHDELRAAGIRIVIYNPLRLLTLPTYNYRTHRKLLVVDGKVGFTGGACISDQWEGNASHPGEYRELHFKAEGPVVAQMQASFAENWIECTGEILHGPDFYPPIQRAGDSAASAFVGAPQHRRSTLEAMFHLAVASAESSIYIENSYFIPEPSFIDALCLASERGVDVIIIIPGEHTDQKSVQIASKKRWPKLLAAGVKIYGYTPTFLHSKLIIVDGLFVSVGSSNLDPRSLRINDEANLNVLDPKFAAVMTRIFRDDLKDSKPLSTEQGILKTIIEAPAAIIQIPIEAQL